MTIENHIPPSIPNYRLIHPVGQGGFGEVWLAETVTGKRRAVKVVYRRRFEFESATGGEVEKLFQLEFEGVRRFEDIASQVPGLITIQHVGRDEEAGFYYYVMPLADDARLEMDDGKYRPLSLEEKIGRDGAMNWKEGVALLGQLSEGLRHLHDAGLCHGDVTSANILYLEGNPVLADPGLTSLDGRVSMTRSPGFSDPHAVRVFDRSGDLFALGRVFYHAVTALHPAEEFPLVPAERMQSLPMAKLAEVLDGCCEPDPEARFQNVDELLTVLGVNGEEIKEMTSEPKLSRKGC